MIKMTLPESTSKRTWRIVDANLNRLGEGLRVIEDVARFVLDDAALTEQLKTIRHEIVRGDWPFNRGLLQARDAEGDVGTDIEVLAEDKLMDLPLIVVANSRRAQESLRVLEELAKMPDIMLDLKSKKFQKARFKLYQIERTLLSRLLRQDKVSRLPGLYVILDRQALGGYSYADVAIKAIRGGASAIQLRDKLGDKRGLLPIAQELKSLCAEHDTLFIMNDHLDLALASDADGLHLGQKDLPVSVARELLPIGKILGCSTTTVDQALAAEAEGVDYIAVGSIYPTTSKETATVIGLERLRQIRQAVTLPLVAIGGINSDNVADVLTAGADSAAVIGAILRGKDVEQATRQIVTRLEAQRGEPANG